MGFTAVNIVEVKVSDVPEGWTAAADLKTNRLTVTAPAGTESDIVMSGTMTLIGTDTKGFVISAKLKIGIGKTIDLTAVPSNCYIANSANSFYSFDGLRKGDGGEQLSTARVDLLWVSSKYMIDYLTFEDGVVSFFVASDDDNKLIEGNGLIAAFDAEDNIIWSWHIWVTAYDPAQESSTSAAGDVFMTRNLGAGGDKNTTNAEILNSYGLYYQWGRPTPMIGPAAYDCASGEDHIMYNARGRFTYLEYVDSSPESGTMDYALAYPMSFIRGVEASGYDWLYYAHNNELWGKTKTVCDPCPRGWKVPDKDVYADFVIGDDHPADKTQELRKAYGWNLTDGTMTSFFLGAGRRSALLGGIQNVNTNANPQPWIGCYWTHGMGSDELSASALYFSLNTEDASLSEFQPQRNYPRANGFQIRCVKVQ